MDSELQKRSPGSGTFPSVLIVSAGQDLTAQVVGYKGFSKAREIGPSVILVRKRRQREVLSCVQSFPDLGQYMGS